MKSLHILLLFSLFAIGCRSLLSPSLASRVPPITAFKDPAFSSVTYRKLAVIVDTHDLEWRKDLEETLVEEMRREGIAAIEGVRLIPPTREWSEQEIRDALATNGVDGYLRLIGGETLIAERHVPATTTTKRERKLKSDTARGGSRLEEVESETVTTTTEEGYTIRTTKIQYRITLVDLRSGRAAWVAVNGIEGDSNEKTKVFCREIVGQLERDSLVSLTDK